MDEAKARDKPPTVGSLVGRAVRSKDQLARDLGAWVLVGPAPAEEANEWSFRTLSARTVRDADGNVEAVLDDTYVVHPLRKQRADAPFKNTILIGRSRTNDVCISHSSVSKLHARVRIADDGRLFLSDAGSSNGTKLGGALLPAEQEQPIESGAQIIFGTCALQLFEPDRFAAILARFANSSGP